MKKALLGAIGLAVMSAPAFAADLPARTYAPPAKVPAMVAPVYDWSGFYIGLNGGGGWNRSCWTNTALFGVTLPSTSEGCLTGSGGTVGGQAGYRWQSDNWVFGVEAQGNWADFNGSNISLLLAPLTNRSKIDAFGLFTGQLGYAANNLLFYMKAGTAVGASSPLNDAMAFLDKSLQEKSKGRLKMEIHINNSLAKGEGAHLEGAQLGTIDVVAIGSAPIGGMFEPTYQALDLRSSEVGIGSRPGLDARSAERQIGHG